MLLQHQSDGSSQARLDSFCRPHARRIDDYGSSREFRFNGRRKSFPLTCKLADNNYFLGGQSADDHADSPAKRVRHLVESLECEGISGLGQG